MDAGLNLGGVLVSVSGSGCATKELECVGGYTNSPRFRKFQGSSLMFRRLSESGASILSCHGRNEDKINDFETK